MFYLLILLIQVILLLILLACWLYFASMLISDFFGVPFVPTRGRSLNQILEPVIFAKNDVFYDLGSGDGRLCFYMAKKYGLKAIGVELNPLLNFYSNLKQRILKQESVEFLRANFFNISLKKATVIYVFLFPEVVNKLYDKIIKECKKGTIIISHGFRIKPLISKEVMTLPQKPFTTYYYRL